MIFLEAFLLSLPGTLQEGLRQQARLHRLPVESFYRVIQAEAPGRT